MQPARRHGDDDIVVAHTMRTEHGIFFDNAGTSAGEVVLVGFEQTRMFRGFTTDQCATRLATAFSNASHDRRDAFGHDLAAGDVVGHEERFGATHHEVIDDHGDEVDPDRVVLVHRLCDGDFGPDTVG